MPSTRTPKRPGEVGTSSSVVPSRSRTAGRSSRSVIAAWVMSVTSQSTSSRRSSFGRWRSRRCSTAVPRSPSGLPDSFSTRSEPRSSPRSSSRVRASTSQLRASSSSSWPRLLQRSRVINRLPSGFRATTSRRRRGSSSSGWIWTSEPVTSRDSRRQRSGGILTDRLAALAKWPRTVRRRNRRARSSEGKSPSSWWRVSSTSSIGSRSRMSPCSRISIPFAAIATAKPYSLRTWCAGRPHQVCACMARSSARRSRAPGRSRPAHRGDQLAALVPGRQQRVRIDAPQRCIGRIRQDLPQQLVGGHRRSVL